MAHTGLLYQLNTLISANEKLIELYRSIYYLLPVKEKYLSSKILWLLEKREELEQKLKKCSFYIRNSVEVDKCSSSTLFRFMPILLKMESFARLKFKQTPQNFVYLEEKKYLKKYFELLYTESLSDKTFKMLLKYKRRHKSIH